MLRLIAFAVTSVLFAQPLAAQDSRPASHCVALSQNTPGVEYIQQAAFRDVIEDDRMVRLSFIDHAMFLIQTHGGVSAVTDYNGYLGGTDFVPTIVTMNRAHSSHWTHAPDPRIEHVLKGWSETGDPANHFTQIGDMLVRSISTNIRSFYDEGQADRNGNAIFVFEAAGMCIAHLGHLHHEPSDEQYAAIGTLDVVMAPVDGGRTLPRPVMIEVLKRMKARMIIPMHWRGRYNLDAFVRDMAQDFDVVETDLHSIDLRFKDLPRSPTVFVLEPAFLQDN